MDDYKRRHRSVERSFHSVSGTRRFFLGRRRNGLVQAFRFNVMFSEGDSTSTRRTPDGQALHELHLPSAGTPWEGGNREVHGHRNFGRNRVFNHTTPGPEAITTGRGLLDR